MALIRPPYAITINGETLGNVEKLKYENEMLYMRIFPTDYIVINKLLMKDNKTRVIKTTGVARRGVEYIAKGKIEVKIFYSLKDIMLLDVYIPVHSLHFEKFDEEQE